MAKVTAEQEKYLFKVLDRGMRDLQKCWDGDVERPVKCDEQNSRYNIDHEVELLESKISSLEQSVFDTLTPSGIQRTSNEKLKRNCSHHKPKGHFKVDLKVKDIEESSLILRILKDNKRLKVAESQTKALVKQVKTLHEEVKELKCRLRKSELLREKQGNLILTLKDERKPRKHKSLSTKVLLNL